MSKTTGITLVREYRGDFKVHMAGCRDIARTHDRTQGPGGQPPTFDAGSLFGSIIAMDEDAASWFCRTAYDGKDEESGESCWSSTNGFGWAPCFADAVKAERIAFGTHGRPYFVADPETVAAIVADASEAEARWVALLDATRGR